MTSILYFSTTWCGPCKMFKPVVQQIAAETGANVQYIDAEQNKELAARYQVSSVPTIVIADEQGVIRKNVGVMSKPQLTQLLSQFR
jgi:thiol-disulfide isomerase/thioredoxin